MSVLTPTIDSIDGENRRIYLKAFVSDFFPIEDIYHEYRNLRRTDPDLRKWAPLLKAEGNVPKGGGAFTPRYVVLIDGTKIVPFDNTTQVNQLGDMITDDPDTDATLYDTSMITVSKVIYIKPSESEIIQLNSDAIVYSTFQGAVWYDVNSPYGSKGSDAEPNGNSERPVNDIPLAVEIADERGFNTIQLRSNVVLDTGDNIENKVLQGINATLTSVVINPGADTLNCEIRDMDVSGTLDGGTTIIDSTIGTLDYVNGSIHHSMINTKITIGGNSVAHIHGCYSGVPGVGTPVIDMGGSGNSLALRDYAGGIEIQNKTGPESVSLDINTGQVILDSTVTNGTIVIRGNVKVTDFSVGDTIVEMDSVTIPETAYNGFVHVHPQDGTSGQAFPFGTETRPIASNDDAVAIALRYNLTKFMMKGIAITSIDAPNSTFVGDGAVQSNIIIGQGFNYADSVFQRLTITGSVPGANCQWEECIFSNATGIQGLFQGCSIFDNLTMDGDIISRGLTLAAVPSILDFGVDTDYTFKSEIDSGTLQLNNFGVNNYAQLSFAQGSMILDSSCVGGIINLHGNVDITDNSGGAVTIIDHTLGKNVSIDVWNSSVGQYVIPETTGYTHLLSTYEGQIHIDSTGISGSAYPAGTAATPVNNIDDALILSDTYGLEEFHVHDDLNIGSADVSGKVFKGTGGITTTIIASGADASKATFDSLLLTGSLTGTEMASKDVILYNLTGYTGSGDNCSLGGTMTMSNTDSFLGQKVTFMSNPTTVDFNYSNATVSFIGDGGALNITRCGTNNSFSTTIHGTTLTIDELCNGGTVLVRGEGVVIDNSNGTVVTDLTTSTENIATQVWDAELSNHLVEGTFGGEVATKADLLASTQTDITVAQSQTLNSGTTVIGDYTDTQGINQTYFEIAEDGTTGIDVEFEFPVPSDSHKASLITVIGHYDGVPTTTHYINLYAWNFDGGSWEKLAEEFMPGLTTEDVKYEQEFYDRHIDRDNNIVRLRLEHNPTSYNTNDRLNLDYIGLSFVEVITAAQIASAVWDEELTSATHDIPDSAGKLVRNQSSNVITTGGVVSSTVNTVTLDGNAADFDGAYDPALIAITSGTGKGQSRLVLQYSGGSKTAVVDRNWKILPDGTSEYSITTSAGREHINEGLAQGGSLNTIILNTSASDEDGTYEGQTVFIRSGLGEDQAHKVKSYDGTTHTVTIYHNWNVIPDITTAYVILPTGSIGLDLIESAVWDANIADHQTTGSTGHWMKKKLLTLANFIGLK